MPVVTKLRSDRRIDRLKDLIALFVTALFVTCAYGQTASTGAVIGVVVDPSGAVVPGVTVRLDRRDAVGGQSFEANQNGQFGFLLIQPGTYSLNVRKNGFSPFTISDIQVPV